MNKILEEVARDWLKKHLAILEEKNHYIFKLMYANGKMELDISTIVDRMSSDKLDHAMVQVQNTIDTIEKQSKNSNEMKGNTQIKDPKVCDFCIDFHKIMRIMDGKHTYKMYELVEEMDDNEWYWLCHNAIDLMKENGLCEKNKSEGE